MFKQLMASIGIGGARIETILHKTAFRKDEPLTGVIKIKGGEVEQTITSIDVNIQTKVKREVNDKTHYETITLQKEHVMDGFVLAPMEERELTFKLDLNKNLPFSMGRTRLWVYTDLNIASAVDPSDHDVITIYPSSGEELVLNAMKQLGGRLKESEMEERHVSLFGGRHFVQELDFTMRHLRNVEEVEICFLDETRDSITLSIEVDKKFTFRRERAYHVTLSKQQSIETQLKEAIDQVSRRS